MSLIIPLRSIDSLLFLNTEWALVSLFSFSFPCLLSSSHSFFKDGNWGLLHTVCHLWLLLRHTEITLKLFTNLIIILISPSITISLVFLMALLYVINNYLFIVIINTYYDYQAKLYLDGKMVASRKVREYTHISDFNDHPLSIGISSGFRDRYYY